MSYGYDLIVAMDRNGAIGRKDKLPWKLKDDLQLFKMMTYDKSIIMGKNTFESIGCLPNRETYVYSASMETDTGQRETFNDDYVVINPKYVDPIGTKHDVDFVIGGAQLYSAFLPHVNKLYVSHVDTVIDDADTFFPEINWDDWEAVSKLNFPQNDRNEFAFQHVMYKRKEQ